MQIPGQNLDRVRNQILASSRAAYPGIGNRSVDKRRYAHEEKVREYDRNGG